jgi:hypothetical protein
MRRPKDARNTLERARVPTRHGLEYGKLDAWARRCGGAVERPRSWTAPIARRKTRVNPLTAYLTRSAPPLMGIAHDLA